MSELLFPLLFFGVIAVVAVLAYKNQQARLEAWRQFAQQKNLSLVNANALANPRMGGRYRGLEVSLQIEVHGSGKQRKTFTRATARFPCAMPRGLNITREGFTDRIAKLVGGQDILIGNAELDRALRIRAEDEPATRTLMENWRVRNAIAAFLARDGQAAVTQHQCTVLRSGFVSAHGELQGMLEAVCRTVTEVQRGLEPQPAAGATPPVEPPASVSRFGWEPGALPAPAPSVPPAPPVPPALPDPPASSPAPLAIMAPPSAPSLSDGPSWSFPPPTEPPPPPLEPVVPLILPEPVDLPLPAPPPAEASREQGDLAELFALDDRSLGAQPQRARVAALQGRILAFELEVERISLTMGISVPAALEGGHTVIGKPHGQPGPRLSVRFPEGAAPGSLGYGDLLVVQARFVSWDEFYRQALLDAV